MPVPLGVCSLLTSVDGTFITQCQNKMHTLTGHSLSVFLESNEWQLKYTLSAACERSLAILDSQKKRQIFHCFIVQQLPKDCNGEAADKVYFFAKSGVLACYP